MVSGLLSALFVLVAGLGMLPPAGARAEVLSGPLRQGEPGSAAGSDGTAPSGSVGGERDPGAQEGGSADAADGGPVLVINVSGLLDPVLVSFVERSISQAEEQDATALVLQLNSEGSVVDDSALTGLARRIVGAEVPVGVWVGPSGAQALGGAAELVGIAEASGMAPGTRLGDLGEQRLPVEEFGPVFGESTDLLEAEVVDDEEALELGLVTQFPAAAPDDADGAGTSVPGAPTVGDFIVNLDGVETREITVEGQRRREPVTVVLFSRLPVLDQLAHTVASPPVAYLLLVAGLALLVFELYTAGIGIAGVVGASCWLAACYGLWVLPTNWWAVALTVAAFVAFAVDVQTGVPRFWTIVGLVLMGTASVRLYDGLSLTWVTLLVAFVGVLLTFLVGMPAMVRSRFSTPAIGREWMVGSVGTAVEEVSETGTVSIDGALWRAETRAEAPIAPGDPVRVVGTQALVLEVHPESRAPSSG